MPISVPGVACGPINVSAADIRRAEAETFYGLNLHREAEDGQDTGAVARPSEGGFLSEVIPPAQRPSLPAPAAPTGPDGSDTPSTGDPTETQTWRFSDDDE